MLKEVNHPANKAKRTFGQKAADVISHVAGSWTFIIFLLIFLVIWMAINVAAAINKWDPYPFILLNLILACLTAIQSPIILMSQNREVQRDRIRAEYDYAVNKKAEREIRELKEDIKEMKRSLKLRS